MFKNVGPVCYSQFLCYISYLFHVIFCQVHCPALPVFLQSIQITRFRVHAHLTMQIRFQNNLGRCLTMFCAYLLNELIFQQIQFSSIAISSAQWSVSEHMYSIFLSSLYQTLLHQIRMGLYLENNWLYFAKCQQLSQSLPIKIRYPQMFRISLFNAQLELGPALLQRHMLPFLSFGVHVGQWPMQVKQIHIVQLHEPQGLLDLENGIKINMVKCLGGNKQIFSFASVLANDCFNGFSQDDLIVIISSCIEMLTIAHLQSFSQNRSHQLFVLYLIGPKSNHMQHLFIRKYFSRRTFLFLFFLSHFIQIQLIIASFKNPFNNLQ